MAYRNNLLDILLSEDSRTAIIRNVNIDSLVKIASGMANSAGGNIIIGMDHVSKDVCGVTEGEIKETIKALSSGVSPSLPYTFNILDEGGKNILVISVWEGGQKPYTAADRFYTQVGESIRIATIEQVDELFEQRNKFDKGWEREFISDFRWDGISTKVCKLFSNKLYELEKCSEGASVSEVCGIMGFKTGTAITNAGVVVMCSHPSEYLPQTRIRVSVFGRGGQEELINVHLYDGNLVCDIDEITSYILSLYPKRIVIEDNQRREVEVLPIVALREGILNACVHRQYDAYNSFVAINLYADRVEIVNSGCLPDGISIDDLSRNHRSILRNPDIANAFYVLGYIEAAGSGTQRILNECKKNHCKAPIWSDKNGLVSLTFPNVKHGLVATTKRDWNAITRELTNDLSVASSLAAILSYLAEHKIVKNSDLAIAVGKSYPTIKRYMHILKQSGLVYYEGTARTGGWMLA